MLPVPQEPSVVHDAPAAEPAAAFFSPRHAFTVTGAGVGAAALVTGSAVVAKINPKQENKFTNKDQCFNFIIVVVNTNQNRQKNRQKTKKQSKIKNWFQKRAKKNNRQK